MNLRRGFLRMWIVTAVCWVAIFGWTLGLPSAEEAHRARVEELGQALNASLACQVEAIAAGRTDIEREGEWAGSRRATGCPDSRALRTRLTAAQEGQEPLSMRDYLAVSGFRVLWNFGPPFALLVAGLAVGWVARGFRP